MTKKNIEEEVTTAPELVDEIGLPQEEVEAPVVEETKSTPTYPKIPKDEGVDPLTASPKILNTEPNNQA